MASILDTIEFEYFFDGENYTYRDTYSDTYIKDNICQFVCDYLKEHTNMSEQELDDIYYNDEAIVNLLDNDLSIYKYCKSEFREKAREKYEDTRANY